jgi:signal transduction histidine kinase
VLAVDGVIRQTQGRIDGVACALAVLTAAPIALRQRAPVGTMWVMLGAVLAFGPLGYGFAEIPNGGISLLIGMFTVATLRPRRVAAVVFLPAMVVTSLFLAIVPATWSTLVQGALVLLGAWMLGESTRRWAERTERLAAQAARAVADERVRIARELHDIVAHHMSVVSLQAGLAQYVLDTDPPTARGAITAAGDASREALSEMRRLLDVLRVDQGTDPESDYRPQPGLAALDELVERTRSAGVPVEVVVTGRARPLAPGPDLCAYRVAQESLTNVLKHAGPASARIELDHGERTFTLTVSDDGRGSGELRSSPASHGIRGMRERAELYGGVLTAGPREDRGFAVVLRLPIGADA